MAHIKHTSALALSLAVACAVAAQGVADADADDAPYVDTPTSLLELLPEGGIDAIDIDFWTVRDVKLGDEAAGEENGLDYRRWSARTVGGTLVIEETFGDTQGYTRDSFTYSADGAFQLFERRSLLFGFTYASLTSGVIVEENLVLTTATIQTNEPQDNPDFAQADDVQITEIPLERHAGTVPYGWMPLVFAYHIREGNTRYRFRAGRFDFPSVASRYIVDDTGEIRVEIDGQQHTARRLVVHSIDTPDGAVPGIERATYVVLNDGSIVSFHRDGGDFTVLTRRITAEDAVALFDLELDPPRGVEDEG